MQITKVEIKNIKNHAEAEFTFRPGVVAICGPNGSGKTTILEAIAWALFDHLDYKRDDFVKRGAKRGQVAVSFISDLDGREYLVSRDTGGGYHIYDPATKTRLVEQKNQVVPWLQQHIGVDQGTDLSSLFKSTIGVPQGAFTYDFTLPPSNRKNIFDQILKVEEYRKSSDSLRETVRHLEGIIAETDKHLAHAEGELKQFEEISREYESAARQMKSFETDLKTANDERERLAGEVDRLNALLRNIETQRGIIERLRVKLELTRQSLAGSREAADQARAAMKIVDEARRGYEVYLSSMKGLAELERRREARDELRVRIAVIDREFIESRSSALRSRERLMEVADAKNELAQIGEKLAEQNELDNRIAAFREGRAELQNLKRSVESIERDLEKLRDSYSILSRQVEAAELLGEKASRIESVEAAVSSLDAEISQKELAIGNYNLKSENLQALKKTENRIAVELERCRIEIDRVEPLRAIAEGLSGIEARRQSQTDKLARLRAEVSRDQEMVSALEHGGICPLLTEKCLNLKPGESLDGRFRSGIAARTEEIKILQNDLDALAEEVKRSRSAETEFSRLSHLQNEAARLEQEIDANGRTIEKIAAEMASLGGAGEQDIRLLKTRRAEYEKELKECREAARVFHQAEVLKHQMDDLARTGESKGKDRDNLLARVAELADIENLLSEATGKLKSLGDPRSRASALDRIIARENEYVTEAAKVERKVAEIGATLDAANAELESFASVDAEISELSKARAGSERDYQSFIAHEKIASTLASREEDVASLTSDLEEAEKSHTAALEELSESGKHYDFDTHRQTQSELDKWRERSTQLAAQLKHTQENFNRIEAQLSHLNRVRERMREHLAEKEKSRKLLETTDFIRDVLQKAAPYITESYLFTISNEANQLFREITGRYDVTLKWAKDYEITLEEEGRERPFLNLSGGEQMAAALSVRLALLKELSDLNLAFFDEPTTNMDEERRRNLAQQIGRIKDFQQLFVISHDDSFEGYTDQIITLGG